MPEPPNGARRRVKRLAAGCLAVLEAVLWLGLYTTLVVYDLRAWMVPVSAFRYVRFPIEPDVVAAVPEPIPASPVDIEHLVERLVPWTPDHEVYGVPWYFPTPSEALAAGHGDCEAQSVLLASLFEARGVPYQFRASFSHLWVDYPGKPRVAGEREEEALMQRVGGRYRFHWPRLPRLREHLRAQMDMLWVPLAPLRKGLLLLGWPLIIMQVRRRRAKRSSERHGGQPA